MVVIGQKTLREKHGTCVMAQLKASVLKAHGRQDGAEVGLTACAMGSQRWCLLQAAMAVTAFGPGGDAPGDVDDEIKLTLPSQIPMIFQDSEVEMQDCVGVSETEVDDAVDHGFPPECAKTLHDVVFRTHLDVFRRAFSGDPPARVEPMAMRLQQNAGMAPAIPPRECNHLQ